MRRLSVLVALLPAACVSAPPLPPVQTAAPFDPFQFFIGRTHGEGRLTVALKRDVATHVDGEGHLAGDGALVLEQRVTEGAKPARTREWRIARIAPGRYRGTLTDASGPVTGEIVAGRLHLTYVMKGGLNVEQWLALEPGGEAARNRLTVSKLGLRIAALDETIRRVR